MADTSIKFIQNSFQQGMNQQVDPTKIAKDEFPLAINTRIRYDILQSIKNPKLVTGLSAGKFQGLYTAGSYVLLFIAGLAYYKNFEFPSSAFAQIVGFLMDPMVDTIWAESVPESTMNFSRSLVGAPINGGVNLTSSITGSARCVVCQDGINPPMIINFVGNARAADGFNEWTMATREYVPIGKQMLYLNGILYLLSPDGRKLYRSIDGRPLDFMVNITAAGNKPPGNEADAGANTTAIPIGFENPTGLFPLNTDDGGFMVSSQRFSNKIIPDFTLPSPFDQPVYDIHPLFPTGALNQFSYIDLLGDSAFIDFTGIRSFNAVQQAKFSGKNLPFSAKVSSLFKNIIQTNPCAGKFDNYALFAVQTVYGSGILIYDEIAQVYVGLDIYAGVAQIKQFAEIITPSYRQLLFITTDNKLYEAFNDVTTATRQIYLGEWTTGDPNVQQQPYQVRVVIVNATEAGTITLQPFCEGKPGTALPKPFIATAPPETVPRVVPFGAVTLKNVQNITWDINQASTPGMKLGLLITIEGDCDISHVAILSESDTQTTDQSREASDWVRFRGGT